MRLRSLILSVAVSVAASPIAACTQSRMHKASEPWPPEGPISGVTTYEVGEPTRKGEAAASDASPPARAHTLAGAPGLPPEGLAVVPPAEGTWTYEITGDAVGDDEPPDTQPETITVVRQADGRLDLERRRPNEPNYLHVTHVRLDDAGLQWETGFTVRAAWLSEDTTCWLDEPVLLMPRGKPGDTNSSEVTAPDCGTTLGRKDTITAVTATSLSFERKAWVVGGGVRREWTISRTYSASLGMVVLSKETERVSGPGGEHTLTQVAKLVALPDGSPPPTA